MNATMNIVNENSCTISPRLTCNYANPEESEWDKNEVIANICRLFTKSACFAICLHSEQSRLVDNTALQTRTVGTYFGFNERSNFHLEW